MQSYHIPGTAAQIERSFQHERASRLVQEERFNEWLRSGHGWSYQETRAAAEGTNSAGGYLVPPGFNASLIRQLREYDGLLKAYELWNSPNGEATVRPLGIPQSAGTVQTENTAIVDGPYFTLGQQSWGQTPIYGASFRVSNQEVLDAFRAWAPGSSGGLPSLDALVASFLGESLGRVIAPVASAALYSTISSVGAASGQDGGYVALAAATAVNYITGSSSTELIQNTINIDTAALMVAALDVAYLPGSAFYFSAQQWANLIRQVDAQKHLQIDPGLDHKLFGYPVVLTSQTSTAVASTVAGPVFGNLEAAMTLRVASGPSDLALFRSSEKYAEYLQTFYRAGLRADVQARDSRAVVGVKYAAT